MKQNMSIYISNGMFHFSDLPNVQYIPVRVTSSFNIPGVGDHQNAFCKKHVLLPGGGSRNRTESLLSIERVLVERFLGVIVG